METLPARQGFRFAMMNAHYLRYSPDYFMDAVARRGFHEIDVLGLMPHLYAPDTGPEEIAHIQQLLQRYQLHIAAYTPGQAAAQLGLSMSHAPAHRRSIGMMKKSVDIAAALGAPSILVTAGFGLCDRPADERWGLFRESVEEIADYAGRFHIDLLLEPLPLEASNVLVTSEDAARFIRETNLANIKCILDVTTMTMENETVDAYFDNLGDRLTYVHLSDGPGQHLYPGNGSYDLDGFLERLRVNGYQGVIALEIKDPSCIYRPNTATDRSIQWLESRGLWPQIVNRKEE